MRTGLPGSGVTDSCGLPCECWELNPGAPIQGWQVILTTDSTLQAAVAVVLNVMCTCMFSCLFGGGILVCACGSYRTNFCVP